MITLLTKLNQQQTVQNWDERS